MIYTSETKRLPPAWSVRIRYALSELRLCWDIVSVLNDSEEPVWYWPVLFRRAVKRLGEGS